jgi:hypothetical protein
MQLYLKKSSIEHSFTIISVSSLLKLIKLYNNLFLIFNISENKENLVFIWHSHDTFFIFLSYSIYLQIFSHNDKYLLLKSDFLLYNIFTLFELHSDIFG